MNAGKRLQTIETSLTPKQAVLFWLKEDHELGLIKSLERGLNRPAADAPRRRIPLLLAAAVQKSLHQQGRAKEYIAHAIHEAQKEADFLLVLASKLKQSAEDECRLNEMHVLLLSARSKGLNLESRLEKRSEPGAWESWWRDLMGRLFSMRRFRETVSNISQTYYDGHPLLHREQGSKLDGQIERLEKMAKDYKSLRRLPRGTSFRPEVVELFAKAAAPANAEDYVALARATSLDDMGDADAAWKIMEPYALAELERLRSDVERDSQELASK